MIKIFQNVTYDSEANACYIKLNDKNVVDTMDSDQEDCRVDIASDGTAVGIEILNASQHYAFINSILLSQKPVDQCVSY